MSTEPISNVFVFVQLTGVAYSRHIVQIYSYQGGDEIRHHLEVHTCMHIHNAYAHAHLLHLIT